MTRASRVGSYVLIGTLVLAAAGLAAWKRGSLAEADAAAAQRIEPVETVSLATAEARQHQRTTTAVGTVVALRSITLRNELAGKVVDVRLEAGHVVEEGALLVAFDVSVEQA